MDTPQTYPQMLELASRVAATQPEHLPQLDEEIRVSWRHPYGQPLDISGWLRIAPLHVLGVLSFHPSGYVREEAVLRMTALDDDAALPYLLLRCGDWVSQVRLAARHAVLQRVGPSSVATFTRNFVLVTRLAKIARADHRELVDALARVFCTTEGEVAVLAVLATPSFAARAIARFVIDETPSLLPAIAWFVPSMPDPVNRTRFLASIPRVLPPDAALPLLQRLAADPSPRVRRDALQTLMQTFPSDAKERAEQGIHDTNVSVREASRWILGRTREEYAIAARAALERASSSSAIATAFTALSEVGTAADATLAARYDAHPLPRVRRAALKCMTRLASDAFVERTLQMLSDPSPAVSALARLVLRRQPLALTRPNLLTLLRDAQSFHVARNIVLLLPELSRWQSILALLDVVVEASDDAVVDLARRQIASWDAMAMRRQTTPTRSEVEAMSAALRRAEKLLDARLIASLRFTLTPFL